MAYITTGALIFVAAILALTLGFGLGDQASENANPAFKIIQSMDQKSRKIKPRFLQDNGSILGNYSKAAVSVDARPCAEIGLDVLKRGGTAVDSAIATLFCDGVFNAHSMGIGGGFLMTIFIKETGEVVSLNAREKAPLASTLNMFDSDPHKAQRGILSAAVPGEIKGYWEAKLKYGNPQVSWESLIQPTIQMCRNGIEVGSSMAKVFESQSKKDMIYNDPGMRATFWNPETNDTWKEGDFYTRNDLAFTLEKIAKNGADEFYFGETAHHLVHDIKKDNGIISIEDLNYYDVVWEPALNVDVADFVIHSVPPPGSGSILAYILNILELYKIQPGDDEAVLHHRIVEAFKWAYALRSQLGDPSDPAITEQVKGLVANMTSEVWAADTWSKINDSFTVNDPLYYGGSFVTPNDHGTAHVSVLSENGDMVSATSTVNLHFGAMYLSPATGIILNDEMDDFSYPNITNNFGLPPSQSNFVKPGKRPMSSMSPAVITDKAGNAKLVLGAAGGTKITTAIAYAAIRNLWLKEDVKRSIDHPRVHHQLMPMLVEHEQGLGEDILAYLSSVGHTLEEQGAAESIVCGIEKGDDGRIYANSDYRKDGGVAGY